jgi:hypothetical protein
MERNKNFRPSNSKSAICLAKFVLLCSLLLAPCFPAAAQQPKKIHRIGYLSSRDEAGESTRAGAIRLALRALGYIEGQNIPSSTAMRRESSIGTPSLLRSWCALKLISSSQGETRRSARR